NLLRNFHRAELRRECRACTSRHDYCRHDRAHVADHADTDEVGYVDSRTKLLKLHRTHKGEDNADQKCDQGYDSNRIGTTVLNNFEKVDSAVARLAAKEAYGGNREVAEELHEIAHREAVSKSRVPDTV